MVVVFPAPFGPEKTEAFSGLNLEVQSAHGLDFAVVSLAQIATLDGNSHGSILSDSTRAASRRLRFPPALC